MARSKKQTEFEDSYVEKIAFLNDVYRERVAFLSTFKLPGYEDTESGSSEDGDGEGGYSGPDANIGSQYDDLINRAGRKHGINPYFIASIIKQESGFNTKARSPVGAAGLMQIMPLHGLKNPNDPEENVMYGTKYIKNLLQQFGWDPVVALGAYNWGEGNVRKAIARGGFPYSGLNAETSKYIKVIPANFKEYTGKALTSENVRWTGQTLSGGAAKGDAKKVLDIATSWLKKSNRYVFGGGRSNADIKAGRFDCSSWCRFIFDQAGYNIMGHDGLWGNTDTVMKNPGLKKVKTSELKPGDLVFFDTYKTYGHITIYMGNNQCIGTQGNTGVAAFDMTSKYWKTRTSDQHRRVLG